MLVTQTFLEKAMAPHSSTLAWKIPWTEEPGRLQSMGSLSRAWLSDFTFTFHFHALEKEMATHSSVLAWRISGTEEPGGLLSMGSHRVGHDWSDLAAAADLLTDMLTTSPDLTPVYLWISLWCSHKRMSSECSFPLFQVALLQDIWFKWYFLWEGCPEFITRIRYLSLVLCQLFTCLITLYRHAMYIFLPHFISSASPGRNAVFIHTPQVPRSVLRTW